MDNLAQAQGIDYIEQYQGMPLQEMSKYLDTQGKKYTDNKEKVDALDIELANEKVLSKGNEAKLAAIERKKNRIKTITEKGDYENGTLLIDEAIKEYKTDKLLNQEKSDLTTYNEYLTKLDQELTKDRITQQDYEQIKQITQATLKPAELDQYGEAVSGVTTIQPAKYVNVLDVLDTKLKEIAVHKYGTNSTVTQKGGEYFIIDNKGFTRDKISPERVKALSKIAIENDEQLQSYLNFKSQLNYKTKALSGTLPKLEDLKGKKDFEDFILVDGMKDLTPEEQVYLYNISETKRKIVNDGLTYGDVKFSYDNVLEFDHQNFKANSNFEAGVRRKKEEEAAKNNFVVTGGAIDNTKTHTETRSSLINIGNKVVDIEKKLVLQQELVELNLEKEKIALDSNGRPVNPLDGARYDAILQREEEIAINNNFTLLTENEVNVLEREAESLTAQKQYHKEKIQKNQLNFLKSAEGEEYVNGINSIITSIGAKLGVSTEITPDQLKTLISTQDLDFLETLTNTTQDKSLSGLTNWFSSSKLGEAVAKQLLRKVGTSTELSKKSGSKIQNLVDAIEDSGVPDIITSARGLLSKTNEAINEYTKNNPTAVTFDITTGGEGSAAREADEDSLLLIKENTNSFIELESGMTLEAEINEVIAKQMEESEEDNPEVPEYKILSATTILNGDLKGSQQVTFEVGGTKYTRLVHDSNYSKAAVLTKATKILIAESQIDINERQRLEALGNSNSLQDVLQIMPSIPVTDATQNAISAVSSMYNPNITSNLITNLETGVRGGYSETEDIRVNFVAITGDTTGNVNDVKAKIFKKVGEGQKGYNYGIKIYNVETQKYDKVKTVFKTLSELQHAMMSGIDTSLIGSL